MPMNLTFSTPTASASTPTSAAAIPPLPKRIVKRDGRDEPFEAARIT